MSVITLGLSEILVAAAAADGVMPADPVKIGKTYKDTCKLVQSAADVTEHYEEGKASPEVRKKAKKMPVLTFSVMDPDAQMLTDYVGGEFTAGVDPAPDTWGFDGSEAVANKAVRVKTEQGLWVDIPNADIEAVINAEFSAKGIFLVDFTVTPLAVTAGKPLLAYQGV